MKNGIGKRKLFDYESLVSTCIHLYCIKVEYICKMCAAQNGGRVKSTT